jgi:hypothetical protein
VSRPTRREAPPGRHARRRFAWKPRASQAPQSASAAEVCSSWPSLRSQGLQRAASGDRVGPGG